MSLAGNFHPEWGYLVPARSFIRTVRTALIATAVGLVVGAVMVLSLVKQPPADARQSVAVRTLARTFDTDSTSVQPASPNGRAANEQTGKPAAGGNDNALRPIGSAIRTMAPHPAKIRAPISVPSVAVPSRRPKDVQTRLATIAGLKALAAGAATGQARAEGKTASKPSGSRNAPRTDIIQIFGDYDPAGHPSAASERGDRRERWGGLFPEIFSIR